MNTLDPGAPADDSEELARAETYGLLSELLRSAPSPALYGRLQLAAAEAPVAGGLLESSFGALVAASRRLPLQAVSDEFDALFQGIGKPEVFAHASFFIAGALNEAPLVALRSELRALGIERDPAIAETEDHIACLCEVMRLLIAGDLATQQRFFDTQLRSWTGALWETIAIHPRSDFYRALASFARDFFNIEAQAFDMLDA